MNESKFIYASDAFKSKALINSFEEYEKMYDQSIKNPDEFWYKIAKEFYWSVLPSGKNVLQYNFNLEKGEIFVKFLEDGETNICYNVLDRHIENGLGEKVAYYWEGNDSNDSKVYTYKYVYDEVCKFANLLRQKGVGKNDVIAVYMPMIIELPIVVLACARIGALHSVIFGGFSAESIADRIIDGKCKLIVTCDGTWRGSKLINLKQLSDKALEICEERQYYMDKCIVVKHVTDDSIKSNGEVVGCRPTKKIQVQMRTYRDEWWHDLMSQSSILGPSPVEWVKAEHPLFLLYTSGSTGKPKGVQHTTAGYMIYTATTFKYVFDHQPNDIYWCTADIGWITGHSYVVYGPMAHAATQVLFEGIPNYPDAGRMWSIVDKYRVSVVYTAPTVVRSLMASGEAYVRQYSRSSLRLLGSVGEPINPRAWLWYYNEVGNGRCPVVDTFWQTETGGHVIAPLPGATPLVPGSATLPLFGVQPGLIDEEGRELMSIDDPNSGYLVFKKPWPGIMRTIFGNHERFENTYFSKFKGYYTTGDGATRDEHGYYTVTGRIDDMLNVSGHLISTAEVESALVAHPSVAEAAVVGAPHPIKGECLYCFIILANNGCVPVKQNTELNAQLRALVREKIGPFATPDYIQETSALPKTRSGKIMRRVLRKVVSNDSDFGDISTLADPNVIDELVVNHKMVSVMSH